MTQHQISLDDLRVEHDPIDRDVAEVTFVGNATLLLRLGGFTILTDPNFLHAGQHAKLGGGLRSRRVRHPAMGFADLPPIDFVVLSHHHGDHFDEIAATGLRRDILILTTPEAAEKLRQQGFTYPIPLQTWEPCTVTRGDREIRVTALPARHGPTAMARLLPETMGSLIEVPSEGAAPPLRVYVSGDTLVHDDLQHIPARFPDIDCAFVHLGGTKVLGVLLTMDGEQGVKLLRIVEPRHAVPIHVDDYTIQRSPLSDFTDAVAAAPDLTTQVHVIERGEQQPLPR